METMMICWEEYFPFQKKVSRKFMRLAFVATLAIHAVQAISENLCKGATEKVHALI